MGSGAQSQHTGLLAPQHDWSSRIRDKTHVPWIGRQILYHRATRKAYICVCVCVYIYTHTHIYISLLLGYIMSDCCDNTDTLNYNSELPEKSRRQRKTLTVPRRFEVMPWSSRGREPTAEHLDPSCVRGIPLQVKRISVQFYKINFWNVTNILNVTSILLYEGTQLGNPFVRWGICL